MFISKAHLVEIFFTKLVFNLKSEAAKTYLSYIWWVLEPVLLVSIFYLVFAVFLARGTSDYVIFLICGKIPFLWFSKAVINSAGSILAGKGLINQVSIPKPFFPILVVFQDTVKQLTVFVLMFAFLALYGIEVSWIWLSVAFIILAQFIFICACSLVVAAITPFLPDFRLLVGTLMMGLMFGSGIFFSYKEVLLPQHQDLFLMNPVANLIKNYRQVLMENTAPDWLALATICLASMVVIFLMSAYFKKTDTVYARLIIQ